jgi:hypothetical protein
VEEQWQFYIIDGFIILIGALLTLNAVIQLFIGFKVKNGAGAKNHSRFKVTKHLILLLVGLALMVSRVLYIVTQNKWYYF